MENVRDGVILVRLLDRKIIDANNAAAELYGYTREELLSLRISDLRAAAERDQIKEQLAKAAAKASFSRPSMSVRTGRSFLWR